MPLLSLRENWLAEEFSSGEQNVKNGGLERKPARSTLGQEGAALLPCLPNCKWLRPWIRWVEHAAVYSAIGSSNVIFKYFIFKHVIFKNVLFKRAPFLRCVIQRFAIFDSLSLR